MPKIPTFQAQGRITAEAAGVRTGIQVSPTASVAAALLPAAKAIEDYHIKQRDNIEKLEARKKFYEMKAESDKLIEKNKNNPDEFASVNLYNEEFGAYKDQQLSQIKNKRVKKRLQDLLDIDQAENVYKIKSNSFDAFENESKVTYENEQNSLANEFNLATDENKKQDILNKRIASASEYENTHQLGKAWLDETIFKIKGDSELFEIEKAITNKDYTGSLKLLKQSKNIDSEEVQKILIQIEKESKNYYRLENIKDAVLNKRAWGFEQKERNDGIDALAETGEYNDSQLSELSITNNAVYGLHKNALTAGFSNAALTGNPNTVRAGYDLYRLYENQKGLTYLKTGMKLTQEQLDFYATLDFMVDTMGMDIRSAMVDYETYYKNQNDPNVKAIVPNATKINNTAKSIADNFFTDDADNIDEIENLVRRYANILLKVRPTDEDAILEQVQNRIERNFKVDGFGQLTAIKPFRIDKHDDSIKAYIKHLWDSNRINKDLNDFDDLIAVDIDPTSTTSLSGIRIINKTFPTTPVILKPAQGDFDSNEFESGIFTQEQLEKVIYPFGSDKRYESYLLRKKANDDKYKVLQQEIIAGKTGIYIEPIE